MKLVPFHEQRVDDLAAWLRYQVHMNRDALERRYCLGVIARYGAGLQEAKAAAERAVRTDSTVAIGREGVASYVAVDERNDDEKIGVMTLYRGLALNGVRRAVPAALARRFSVLCTEHPLVPNAVNVTAWAAEGHYGELWSVYREGGERVVGDGEVPWTVEPVGSGVIGGTHRDIRLAGFDEVQVPPERYDVGEPGRAIPPISQLYSIGQVLQTA